MKAPSLMNAQESALVIVDIQARLAPAIYAGEAATRRAAILLQAAAELDIPVVATEQYSKGLGHSLPEISKLLPAGAVVEKTTFSALREPAFRERLVAMHRRQILVCGMETHVCVLQTALELLSEGYEVFVVADACGSRSREDREVGLNRLAEAGCHVVTSEMAVFEWLGEAGNDLFRRVSRLIK